jgi:two-component system, cell cycle sensor histidine kinase and response regulator CckA
LVDDENMILSVGERMLRRLGFEVVTAADGVEAIELFQVLHKELICVVLDLSMPRKDGEEAYREMLAMRPDAVVIIASGYAQDQIGARFQGRPPAGYIRKPYQLKDLSRVLAEALGE